MSLSLLHQRITELDRYHHYYHYQASAHYSWLGAACEALGDADGARAAYGRAIFQDHANGFALARKAALARGEMAQATPDYCEHAQTDHEFRRLTGRSPSPATAAYDEAAAALADGDAERGAACIQQALAADPAHADSYFLRGRAHFAQGDFAAAKADFTEAARLSHLDHQAYHRTASAARLERGRHFAASGEWDLAINDFTKALDLHGANRDALIARADAYWQKGSLDLAALDDLRLMPPAN